MAINWTVSVESCVEAIRTGTITARAIAEATLQAIAAKDGVTKAFTQINARDVLEDAGAVDSRFAAGRGLGPLAGVPIGLKDLFDVRGMPTSYGVGPFEPRIALRDAEAVGRLRRAGALLIGKTRTSNFGWSMTTGPTTNPRDPRLVVGGSSGGSAAAVGAGLVHVALGTDTGGSIRIPAALCGVSGIKPTFGLVSRSGVLPSSWSLDTVGPLARSTEDLRPVLRQIVGHDPKDPSSAPAPVISRVRHNLSTSSRVRLNGLGLGLINGPLFEIVDPGARDHYAGVLDLLTRHGVRIVALDLSNSELISATQSVIALLEFAAIHTERMRQRGEEFTQDVRSALHVAHIVPGVLLARAYQARQRIKTTVARLFKAHDLDALIAPATGASPGPRDNLTLEFARSSGPNELALLAYGRPSLLANLTGQPALVLPTSRTPTPFGIQLIGKPFYDHEILNIGQTVEEILSQ